MPPKILFIFCFYLGVFYSSIAQQINGFTEIDSIKSTYSSAGKLSSIDLSTGHLLSTLGFASNQPFLFDPLNLLYTGLTFNSLQPTKSIRYSSLPHIGFAYSFGSSGFQFAKFQYTQAFSNKWIINLDYKNQQTNGVLRNSAARNQLVNLKISKQSKIVESLLLANYAVQTFGWNGGISEDSLSLSYSPELIPVLKNDAISTRKEVLINWMNYIHLFADSSQKTGAYFNTDFHSRNRIYRETGELSSQYNQIFVDSFETYDHVQISSQSNEIGFFTARKSWKFATGINQAFWNYRNGILYRDTLEVDLHQAFSLKFPSLNIEQNFSFNLLGRGQSWKNVVSMHKKWKKSSLKGSWNIENSWPELFQRHYFSNNINYQLPIYELQFKNKLDLSYDLLVNKNNLHFKISHLYLKNPYFFNGATWSNTLINTMNSVSATVSSDIKYKSLTISPSYSFYSLPSNWKFYPNHLIKLRLSVERGVLKKRKLISYFGIEPQMIGRFSPLSIYPSMDVFIISTNLPSQSAFLDLALFAGFELKGFKFFARAENLGYFWNNRMLQLAKGYPIPPMQIQIGITWDFWN
jgi:hypothetical protein